MEEMHVQGRWEEIPSFHTLLGHTTLSAPPYVRQLGALQNTYCWYFYGGFNAEAQLVIIPFPVLLPSSETSTVDRKLQASNHGLVFLVTSPDPRADQSCLIRTKDTAITLTGNCKGFGSSVPRDK